MSILIDVEDYCQECLDFEPHVIKARRMMVDWGEGYEQTNTQIQCEYRKRCAGIKRYLESQAKTETEAVG